MQPEENPMLNPTQKLQQQFAANIRGLNGAELPQGVERRRMGVYQELFYNNIEDFLSTGFPVLRTLYSDSAWNSLVAEFIRDYRCTTPYFAEIPMEFLEFLQNRSHSNPEDPVFLLELAHYEWVELELSISTDEPDWEYGNRRLDPLQGVPVLSPLVRSLQYSFPVHTIAVDQIPLAPSPQPHFLVVYRDRDGEIHFMESSPFVSRLLELIHTETNISGQQAMDTIAQESGLELNETLLQQGAQMLNNLLSRGILLGYKTTQ
ncbi:MAG: DUF2063 domain-containing protein [Gammaproteobacteria bacterium]|jgi:hypothetical protein|nr:DUF2063 domain-containing protein [Gammaproteobacteria bacterium]MBT3490185.1 DUF2063 domain-containing protein [Gammaproteobacteria bacterium]MBT3718752.1 DUF2063 domain-containing protein [Gammaproteobacteria bacterium]MBT3845755.1 DUF2063 domain-containing protein [Gammaproteobacteria bacterium]MBT3892037.1 DUF2063 domain-containing protein [Gammaproteobacteria bacterium]